MNQNFDDPKLTAYALGELEGEERAEVETILANNPAARQWVEEVWRTATRLENELGAEQIPQLRGEQVETIESELTLRKEEAKQPKWNPAEPRHRKSLFQFRLINALAVVGSVALLAAMLFPTFSVSKSKSKNMAMRDELRRIESQSEVMNRPAKPLPEPAVALPESTPTTPPHEPEVTFRSRYGLRVLPDQTTPTAQFNTESYSPIADSGFLSIADNPLSTFSIDVDTASYSIMRRFLNERRLPPRDSVRIEELVNYFSYAYRPPTDGHPFSVSVEIASCPWSEEHRLICVGLKGREIARDKRPPSNLVFLVDVSGSMQPANKLPLLKQCLRLLTQQLTEDDHVAIVVYAGKAGEVLPSTSGDNQKKILRSLDNLEAGGSTHGSQGIQLAYRTATDNFIPGGVNRVILCTDGDFNVGVTSPGELVRLIEDKAKSGVFLTVLGFGMGNYKDSTTEMLADKGNGNYAYIDTLQEGRKVLVKQISGTLVTIAKDVKIQVEFNPAQAKAYRLIGYENRRLKKEDFNNDQKDAGDIGAGHTVTALYEVVPVGVSLNAPGVVPLKYQRPARRSKAAESDELLTLKLRYKEPDGNLSKLITTSVTDTGRKYAQASDDFKFASAVVGFGMILRDSPYKGTASFDGVRELAEESQGRVPEGYREEFLRLVDQAKALQSGRRR